MDKELKHCKSNLKTRMALYSKIAIISFVGVLISKYLLPESDLKSVIQPIVILAFAGSIITMLFVSCEICNTRLIISPTGWGLKNLRNIGEKFDPLDIPDNCRVCGAEFE